MNLPRAGQSQPKGRIRPAGRKMPRSGLARILVIRLCILGSVATQINFKNIKIYHKLHQTLGQNIKRKKDINLSKKDRKLPYLVTSFVVKIYNSYFSNCLITTLQITVSY